jgi:RNA polymerase sigma-70 factor, ECF subfamily
LNRSGFGQHVPAESKTTVLSDEELMALVAKGDSGALEVLYSRYGRVAYGLALRMLANAEHAEEVAQEAFWRVWRRSATFQAHAMFAPWLFGIVRNLCIDELRRRQSRPVAGGSGDEELLQATPDQTQDMDEQVWDSERRKLIMQALEELPADQRQVIELAYFAGLSQREIAEQLNNPLGTVKTRTRLALQKLKQMLLGLGIGQDDR